MPMRFRVLGPTDELNGGQPFASLEELIAARDQIAGPVLVVAPKEQVGALLEHLRGEDDVCLRSA